MQGAGIRRWGAEMNEILKFLNGFSSAQFMLLLIAIYLVILVLSVKEKNYPRALYWLGAIILNIGVLWGTK
jgi:uncharacterized membrane-anchored protein